ncbi:hypothetical protein V8F33_007486 [Rhypophila sp. PSN 637]
MIPSRFLPGLSFLVYYYYLVFFPLGFLHAGVVVVLAAREDYNVTHVVRNMHRIGIVADEMSAAAAALTPGSCWSWRDISRDLRELTELFDQNAQALEAGPVATAIPNHEVALEFRHLTSELLAMMSHVLRVGTVRPSYACKFLGTRGHFQDGLVAWYPAFMRYLDAVMYFDYFEHEMPYLKGLLEHSAVLLVDVFES